MIKLYVKQRLENVVCPGAKHKLEGWLQRGSSLLHTETVSSDDEHATTAQNIFIRKRVAASETMRTMLQTKESAAKSQNTYMNKHAADTEGSLGSLPGL